jgi:hypothetical protein
MLRHTDEKQREPDVQEALQRISRKVLRALAYLDLHEPSHQ